MQHQWVIRRLIFAGAVFGTVIALVVALLVPQLQSLFDSKAQANTPSTSGSFGVYVGVGTLNSTVPYNTDALIGASSEVLAGQWIHFELTKPDGAKITFLQKTDQEGRIRGQLYYTVVDQPGLYTLTVLSPSIVAGASDTFEVKEWAVVTPEPDPEPDTESTPEPSPTPEN